MVFFFRNIEDDWTNVYDKNLSVSDGQPQSNNQQKNQEHQRPDCPNLEIHPNYMAREI